MNKWDFSCNFALVMSISIELKNLTTGYKLKSGEKVIAQNLSASLNSGEMTCLLGPNGAGKSTLLRTLAAFQPALGGTVEVMGQDIKKYKSKDLAQLMSVVLTDNSGIKNMTAEEVVAMGRSPYTGFWGKLNEKDKVVVKKSLGWVGIEELAQRKMQTLSDGERQKVMIAKAIAQETPIILLDEPTAYLDYPSKIAMMLLLHRLAKALKKTIFMSTHDLEHALQVADQIWLLDHEKGLTTGMPEDLSIDGSIEHYFSREDMVFDRESCTFSITYETARDIVVEGAKDSLEYRLCCKALMRNGMMPVDAPRENNARPDVTVKVPGDGTYRLIEQGKESIKVDKMGHLLHMIVPAITKYQISAIREAAEMNPYE
ncbi:MAG: ABC transporter ATP-binding protein [Bacteroidaceae bacterium]|nr:ABC transporter ATP-binding protein [Bacteroidaceae bacterium]